MAIPYHLSSLMEQLGSVHISVFLNGIDIFDHALCSVVASWNPGSLLEGRDLLNNFRFILLAAGKGISMDLDSTGRSLGIRRTDLV